VDPAQTRSPLVAKWSGSSTLGEEVIRMLQVALVYVKGLAAKMRSEEGATAVEYGLMVALIAVVIIAAVTAVGVALKGKFEGVGSALG
jgi:pilus assembly protein Flp/PilA